MQESGGFRETIQHLLDGITTTAKSYDHLNWAYENRIDSLNKEMGEQLDGLAHLVEETMHDCNEIIRRIGGIPVKISGDMDCRVVSVEDYQAGSWVFNCISREVAQPFKNFGSVEQLKKIYSEALDLPEDLQP